MGMTQPRVTNWTSQYHSDSLKVSLIMFSLKMVDYPMFFLSLSTWNDFGHLPDTQKGTQRWYLHYVCLPTQPLNKFWGGW